MPFGESRDRWFMVVVSSCREILGYVPQRARPLLLVATQEHSSETAVDKRRKVGTTSNHHAPYDLGYTRNTMAVNKGMQSREAERTPKSRPSSDRRLQPACVKSESLVIVGQHTTVNTFPGLVHTARHTMRVGNTRSP